MPAQSVFRNRVLKRPDKPLRPNDRHGEPAVGRIASLLVGQGHGFISLRGDRRIFFHRGDLLEGTSFNALRVGDTVTFELFDDPVSGPRALRVTRERPRRRAAKSSQGG